jgi:hypothetical protein
MICGLEKQLSGKKQILLTAVTASANSMSPFLPLAFLSAATTGEDIFFFPSALALSQFEHPLQTTAFILMIGRFGLHFILQCSDKCSNCPSAYCDVLLKSNSIPSLNVSALRIARITGHHHSMHTRI